MPEAATDLITSLQSQEEELVLDSFDHTDAWTLGAGLVEVARAAGRDRARPADFPIIPRVLA